MSVAAPPPPVSQLPAIAPGAGTKQSRGDKPRSIDELLTTVSASRLNCFHQCRLKFYFQYVLGLRKAKSAALFIGSVIHSVLKTWNRMRWQKQPVATEMLRVVMDVAWVEEQQDSAIRWKDAETVVKKDSWELLQIYLRDTPIKYEEKIEAVEVGVETDLRRYGLPTIVGFIDLVREGGKIVDYKSTSKTPNKEKAVHLNETQLSCYAITYRDATGHKEGGIELHHLVKLKKPKLVVVSLGQMDQRQETRLFRSMESYVKGVEQEDWVPSPNVMNCSCCEYFNECRRWCGKEGR
jgi:putative RecB family exonuclease